MALNFSANPALVQGFSSKLREGEVEEVDADGNLIDNLPYLVPN